jgi:SAM-dependent methyltransferase
MTSISNLVREWYSDSEFWDKNSNNFDPNDFDLQIINNDTHIKDKVILNLGCFYPRVELFLSHLAKSWTAIDFSEEVIRKCKEIEKLKHVNFKLIDINHLAIRSDLPPESFDTILDLSTGDHLSLQNYAIMVGNVYNLLKPNGFFITTYANLKYGGQEDVYTQHGYERWIYPDDLYKIMLLNNFTIISSISNGPRSGVICQKVIRQG